jgi:CBS domain-containing protein
MSTIREILATKGTGVYTVGPDTTVLDAAILMNDNKIGCLVVTVGDRVHGIFTERDILRRIVAQRRDPAKTRVDEVMTEEVTCCSRDTSIDDAREVFRSRRIRHLPVVDEQRRLAGLISIGDLNAHLSKRQEVEIQYLHFYINGESASPARHG